MLKYNDLLINNRLLDVQERERVLVYKEGLITQNLLTVYTYFLKKEQKLKWRDFIKINQN